MKRKTFKYLFVFLISLFTLAIFNSVKASAASTDLYFPDKTLASGYNEDGKATIDDLVVYAHNNGAGYNFSNKVKVSYVDIITNDGGLIIGLPTNRISVDTSSSNMEQLKNDSRYGTPTDYLTNEVAKITIPLSELTDLVNGTNNNVSIKIKLESKTSCFFGCSYEDYSKKTTINYYKKNDYKGSSNGETAIPYYKTTSTLATSKFSITSNTFKKSSDSGCSDASYLCYSTDDISIGNTISLEITTAFAFNGTIRAYYTSSKFVDISFSNSKKQSTSVNVSNWFGSNVNKTASMYYYMTVSATDYYGSAITCALSEYNAMAKMKVDTLLPTVSSVNIIDPAVGNYNDWVNATFSFTFSKVVIANVSVVRYATSTDSKVISKAVSCATTNSSEATSTLSCPAVAILGDGELLIKGYRVTMTDLHGNQKTINISNLSENTGIVLASSIKGVEVRDGKEYFYNGDTVNIDVSIDSSTTQFSDYSAVKLTYNTNQEYTFTDANVSVNGNVMTLSYTIPANSTISKINYIRFYKENNVVGTSALNLTVGQYFRSSDLRLKNTTITTSAPAIVINGNKNIEFELAVNDTSKIKLKASNNSLYDLTCTSLNGVTTCVINDTTISDGLYTLNIGTGAFKNADNKGLIGDEYNGLSLVINKKAPVATVNVKNANVVLYSGTLYFKEATDVVSFSLSDGYAEKLCVQYRFAAANNFTELCNDDGTIAIELPKNKAQFSIEYKTNDGLNTSASTTYEYQFSYRNEFTLSNIAININNVAIGTQDDNYYNYVNISYSNAGGADLMSSFKYEFKIKSETYTSTSSANSYTFNYPANNLVSNTDDVVNITVTLKDGLNNELQLTKQINIDNVAPSFDILAINQIDSGANHVVYVINDDEDSDIVDIYAKDDSHDHINLTYHSFGTTCDTYTLVITDKAGNTREKEYVTTIPEIELFKINGYNDSEEYEINITPFVGGMHTVDSIQYLVFPYMNIPASTDSARKNMCTVGRVENCYVNITSFVPSSSTHTVKFKRNQSYVILLKINGVFVNYVGSNSYPVLNVGELDITAPVGEYLEEDINPSYVSSNYADNYSFRFYANDTNLSTSYRYLVVKSSASVTKSNFNDRYNSCYQYGATNANSTCAIRGEKEYKEISTGRALGELVLSDNGSTTRRFLNSQEYTLYVLLSDKSNNTTLFSVYTFINVSEPSILKYYNNDNELVSLADGDVVRTNSATRLFVSRYANVDIKKFILDGNDETCNPVSGCDRTLSLGKHVAKVEDVLGNTRTVTIYSGVSNYPEVNVYYKNGLDYITIEDTSYSYNTTNTDKVYVKVVSADVTRIRVKMSNELEYTSGNALFDDMMNSGTYGTTIAEIMSGQGEPAYTGEIKLKFINNQGGETELTLTVDNNPPSITLVNSGTQVEIYSKLFTVTLSDGKYTMNINYNGVTHLDLMKALIVKADGKNFVDVKDSARFTYTLNDNSFNQYDSIIPLGSNTIKLDYLDEAGNAATQKILLINIIDIEDPEIAVNDFVTSIELNSVRDLTSGVMVTDNYDSTLVVVTKIDGVAILDASSHLFDTLGNYTITYCSSDSAGNEACLDKAIEVVDTLAPTLKENTEINHTAGINKLLTFNLPEFDDNDPILANLKADREMIKVFAPGNVELSKLNSNYPLTLDGDTVNLRFDATYPLGVYKILFVAIDNNNNVTEVYYNITVRDNTAPVISAKINDVVISDNETKEYIWGSELILNVSVNDEYEGDLTSNSTVSIEKNNKRVPRIDSQVSGEYLVRIGTRDSSNNESVLNFKVVIQEDNILPSIDKFLINGVEVTDDAVNNINYSSLNIEVLASDNSNSVNVVIDFNHLASLRNGSIVDLEISEDMEYYFYITVTDSSNNEVTKEYHLHIDNQKPQINGVAHLETRDENITIGVSDKNISSIKLYKDNVLVNTYTTDIYELTLSENGLYAIEARDTFDNKQTYLFTINKEKAFSLIDSSMSISQWTFDKAGLVKARYDENGYLFLSNNALGVGTNDKVYLFVKYPGSNYKVLAYSMNGETYNRNSSFRFNSELIEGLDGADLLENIGGETYAYVAVVVDRNSPENSEGAIKNESDSAIKTAAIVIASITGIALALFLIVKLRRRVRAV